MTFFPKLRFDFITPMIRSAICLLVVLAVSLFSRSARATTYTWLGSSVAWSVATNWSPLATPAASDEADFTGTFANSPTISTTASLGEFHALGTLAQSFSTVLSSTLTLAGSASNITSIVIDYNNTATNNVVTFLGSGSMSVSTTGQSWVNNNTNGSGFATPGSGNYSLLVASNVFIGGNSSLTLSGSGATAITGRITGFGTLAVNNGLALLSASNAFSGGVSVSSGTLMVPSISNLGVAQPSGTGTLTLGGSSSNGELYLLPTAGTNSTNRGISLGAGGGTIVASGSNNFFSGNITGSGGLTFAGPGNLFLSGLNPYTGGTTVSGGLLLVNSITGTGFGPVQVFGGASLGGTGSISGALTVAGGTSSSTYGSINLWNGTTRTLSIFNSLAMGSPNGYSVLDLGYSTSGFNQLFVAGPLSLSGSGVQIGLNSISGGSIAAGTYPILTAASGVNGNQFSFQGTGGASESIGTETFVLVNSGGTSESIQVAPGPQPTIGAITSQTGLQIIKGGSTPFTFIVQNTGPGTLHFSAAPATNTSGSVTGPVVVPSGGTSSATSGLSFGGTTVGLAQTGTFTVSDSFATNTPQTGTVTVDVFDHASPVATGTTISLPIVHYGYSGSVAGSTSASIANAAGTRVNLMTSGGATANGVTLSGDLSGLTPGGAAGNIGATLANGQAAGPINQSFAVTYADNSSLPGASGNLGTLTITVTGGVFSGNALWTGTSGSSWSTSANYRDLLNPAVQAAPGVWAGFNDTLVLNDSASNRTVNLDGATPNLSSLTVGTSNDLGYTLGQGSGGSLVLNNGANAAAIAVTGGLQTISAPVVLASPLNVTFSAASQLVLSGSVSEVTPGTSLSMSGVGQLTITGTAAYTGGTTISQGTLNAAGALLGGGNVVLAANTALTGAGSVLGNISGAAASTIQATGNLTLGNSASYTGVNHAGTLVVGPNLVTLNCAGFANLGVLTTLRGGTLAAPNGVTIPLGGNLVGSGIVAGKIAAGYGSTINATGNLTLGDAASPAGFTSDGELYTNANTVTLNSSNAANNQNAVVLGSLTQINGGGLVATNGILLSAGDNLVTTDAGGTVSGGTSARFLNRGSVQGPSSATTNWLTFNLLFKGSTGQSSGRIAFLGGYATGDSPGVNNQSGATELGGSGSEFDVGGKTPGNGSNYYGQLNVLTPLSDPNDQGNLILLPGASIKIVDWNGFIPTIGNEFTVLTWSGSLQGTAAVAIDPAFAAEGVTLVPQWNANSLVVTAVPEPSGLMLLVVALAGMALLRGRV
jgi:fibronectin-binding autotransporter adhesin